MSETMASLRRKIDSAGDLQSVVRTMKAVAASKNLPAIMGGSTATLRALIREYLFVSLFLSFAWAVRQAALTRIPVCYCMSADKKGRG